MTQSKARPPQNPNNIVVAYALLGRNEDAAAEMLRRIKGAPYWQQRELRDRLKQAVALFAEARERHDRLGIYRR